MMVSGRRGRWERVFIESSDSPCSRHEFLTHVHCTKHEHHGGGHMAMIIITYVVN